LKKLAKKIHQKIPAYTFLFSFNKGANVGCLLFGLQGHCIARNRRVEFASLIILQRRYCQLCLRNKFDMDQRKSQIGMKEG
jgi:hypothetical protein